MNINTGRLTPLERTLRRWPLWKKILLILFGFAALGLFCGMVEGLAEITADILNDFIFN